jgi:hypothetical protein
MRSDASLAISCRSRQDFIKPVWLTRLSNGKASAMETAPRLITINQPLALPYAWVQLKTGDRGISLHGRDNTGRSHNFGNALPFALGIDNVAQSRKSLLSHASNTGCQCSFEPCSIPTATWHPDTASMLRRQGVMCRSIAVIGSSPRQGRASASDLT